MALLQAKLPNRRVAFVLALFGVAYGLLSLVNHYLFRTYTYDLGIYNQALWDYAHLRLNANSVIRYNNLFSDHLTLVQLFWGPLYWLFGSYTLMLVQIGLMLLGGFGAYRLHVLRTQGAQPGAALALLVLFLSTWGIYSALAFDYHDNVVAAMLLPWLLYYLEADRRGRATVVALLMTMSKENMALWVVFIGLGLAALHWREPARRRWALLVAGGAGLYFVLVVKVIIPALGSGHPYLYQGQYAVLGTTPGEMLHTVFTRPLYLLKVLFTNHLDTPGGDYVKTELHKMVLLSGGLALLRRPGYLLMLAPIYGQKLLSSSIQHWGINYQYSIEFVPVIHAALSAWLVKSKPQQATILAAGAAAIAIIATVDSMQERLSPYYDEAATNIFSGRHYHVDFDAAAVHRGLATIPATARVSATSAVVPHLAARAFIYPYPYVADADYIVALQHASIYPVSEAELDAQLADYQANGLWEVALEQGPLRILRRVQPLPEPTKRFFRYRADGKEAQADPVSAVD
ncbi:DUF2079 domain-containing protein [Hymenobacter arizonensis]|uniref:Uncharacterized membrane protein n=1 Tax=Hymenobacter arizonensis TaxID=1227077 RepID=A0A1I5X5Q2_HYMAR|nr:DUF2079 domain-containing protein [Hymenobacter arizonensis]SFQ27280.1 Uncharacterized membrane protein [Hymenobacter arizonensis]